MGEYVNDKERTKLSADKIVILSLQKGLEGEAKRFNSNMHKCMSKNRKRNDGI